MNILNRGCVYVPLVESLLERDIYSRSVLILPHYQPCAIPTYYKPQHRSPPYIGLYTNCISCLRHCISPYMGAGMN